jgi:hypothetical protein
MYIGPPKNKYISAKGLPVKIPPKIQFINSGYNIGISGGIIITRTREIIFEIRLFIYLTDACHSCTNF